MYLEKPALDRGTDHLALLDQEIRVIARSPSHFLACTLLMSASGSLLISALYLMKSACGIDLMAGPSPMHYLFF